MARPSEAFGTRTVFQDTVFQEYGFQECESYSADARGVRGAT